MAIKTASRISLLQGTLDVLVLRTLLPGPAHGHSIAKHIQRTSEGVLQIETGSLYPALHRLEAQGLVTSHWKQSERRKRAKYYRLTTQGKKQLVSEQSRWQVFAKAMEMVLQPLDEELS